MQVDTASKEVQHLQGQLSDLNAVLSNHVASTKLETLHDQLAKMNASNHTERQRVDAVYANRAAKQRQTKEVQATAEQIQKQLEQKVHEMSIEQQQQYYNLQVQYARLTAPCCHSALSPFCVVVRADIWHDPRAQTMLLSISAVLASYLSFMLPACLCQYCMPVVCCKMMSGDAVSDAMMHANGALF